MSDLRIIARLDVKGRRVVKGIYYEGWRDMGEPAAMASRYYSEGADEIFFTDIFASLTRRDPLLDVIRSVADNVYVPITVGGGIRTAEDAKEVLRAGADKVAINTHAVARPELISEVAQKFGCQCVVVSIEAKQRPWGYEAYVDHGRNPTGVNAIEWAEKAVELGAGEIFLSCVDTDGAGRGPDFRLIKQVAGRVSMPVIAGSGISRMEHLRDCVSCGARAVAVASMLHYNRAKISEMKGYLEKIGVRVRK